MRGSAVECGVAALGALGFIGLVTSDFHPSTGLFVAACVIALALACWAVRAQPKPEEVYSPLQGKRRLRSPYSPTWVVFPVALVAGWLFTVYGAGMALAAVAGTQHTRQAVVAFSRYREPSRRSLFPWRQRCVIVAGVVQTGRGPVDVYRCERSLGNVLIGRGSPITYQTRESALGVFFELRSDWSEVDSALKMARDAEEQARQGQEAAARR